MLKKLVLGSLLALSTFAVIFLFARSYVYAGNNHGYHTPTPHPTHTPYPTIHPCGWNDWKSEDCETPTASPSATPTNSPTPTTTPTSSPCEEYVGEIVALVEEVPCETPTPTETPVETPDTNPTPNFVPLTEAGAPQSPVCSTNLIVPTVLAFNRPTPNSVHISWSKTDPFTNYVIYYGTSQFTLPWNKSVVNTHETDLNDLPLESIWVKVAATDNGCVGPFSVTIDP